MKITDKETTRLVKHNKTTQVEVHTLFVYLTTLHVMSQQAKIIRPGQRDETCCTTVHNTRHKWTWRGNGGDALQREGEGGSLLQ